PLLMRSTTAAVHSLQMPVRPASTWPTGQLQPPPVVPSASPCRLQVGVSRPTLLARSTPPMAEPERAALPPPSAASMAVARTMQPVQFYSGAHLPALIPSLIAGAALRSAVPVLRARLARPRACPTLNPTDG